ncbi:hypothetical protein, partial [Nostoc linckia]
MAQSFLVARSFYQNGKKNARTIFTNLVLKAEKNRVTIRRMNTKLKTWMNDTGRNDRILAEEIGVATVSVWRWWNCQRVPRPAHIQKLVALSKGHLQYADF